MTTRAFAKDASGNWVEQEHWADLRGRATVIRAEVVRQVLRGHEFQQAEPPGLYPEQPTICSCGTTAERPPPEGDYHWWVDHVATQMTKET